MNEKNVELRNNESREERSAFVAAFCEELAADCTELSVYLKSTRDILGGDSSRECRDALKSTIVFLRSAEPLMRELADAISCAPDTGGES